ncbi:hypothetical protein VC83_07956 [Pseudogymnoascus destructans]|uniref:Restriction of telomere capping protein 4 n=2 Tax=Pseudogymnoascus destructans TaxID=655981 RepID=A0A177A4I8_9PEZI|nr:uncharacterized protein VC83_07956 [Pseudogymnoascus destructans]OAF56003.1 hypothetical protein VC83_07956 [Pseudogymnoascus destructans]
MSTKEDRRRVGLYPDNRVAPLLKTVGGKSTGRNPTQKNARASAGAAITGNDSKKRKTDDASDSDDSNNGDIKSQFDRGRHRSENSTLNTRKPEAEPAYIPGSYKGTAFRGAARKIGQARGYMEGPETQRPKKNISKPMPVPEQKPNFKTYAAIAASPPPKKPAFNDYGAGKKPAPTVRCPSPGQKPTFKTYAPSTAIEGPPKPAFKDYGLRGKLGKPGKPEKPEKLRKLRKPAKLARPEKPVFNTYGGALKTHPRDSDSDEQIYLSSQTRDSPARHIDSEGTPPPTHNPNETKCPMCGTYVPLSLLLAFASSFPSVDPFAMRIQVQSRFCSHHRRHTAASSANYPPVAWPELPSRIRAHLPSIRTFLDDPDSAPSHYRDLLAKDIAAGRNRTLMQSIMSEAGARVRVPGYYGPRGARVIQEEVLDALSGELREAAVRDVVVSARGVGVYVTSVLVLEVGLLLVMDDLGVGREDARGVMEKSAAWGTLVNEELDEEVPEDAEASDEFEM